MTARRRIAILLLTAAATAGLGWLSRAPFSPPDADLALLRLSWRLRGEKSETCRPRTQDELDALPVHMRTPEVCETHLLAYHLVVHVDGTVADTATVLPGGARGDRPVFVLRDVPLSPGFHEISVRFARAGEPEDADDAREDGQRRGRPHRDIEPGHHRSESEARNGGPASLALETELTAGPGDIHLITLSAEARHLVHVAPRTH